MPTRHSTKDGYMSILKVVRRDWGSKTLPLMADEVEYWLQSLKSTRTGKHLAPKTEANVKAMLYTLHCVAMLWRYIPVGLNPMSLVKVPGSGTRQKNPVILTMEEFRKLLAEIQNEPYRTMVLVAACLGLRISEVLGLRWLDFDWLRSEVSISRAVVDGRTNDVKTRSSRKKLPLAEALIRILKNWKLQTQFSAESDYVFASPVMLGTQPLHGYSAQRDQLKPAAIRAGLNPIGWHSLRHSYRTWLDETGAPITAQRELMRHSTISMTLDTYGRGVAAANRDANSRLVGELLN